MRAKAIFTVFGRRLPSGKRVFYYQCYDEKGKRQWAKSTGLSKKDRGDGLLPEVIQGRTLNS